MIEINNLTAISVNEEFLKKVVRKVLRGEKTKKHGLSIVLVSPEKMRRLNKEYRKKSRVADVLAFGQSQKSLMRSITRSEVTGPKAESQKFPDSLKSELGLGEVVICPGKVKKNAKRFSSTFKAELTACLIHGVLHLLGYDHEKGGKETARMEKKQKYYLSQIRFF